MSTREMICDLVRDSVPSDDLELLYQLILKFIPTDEPLADELEAIKNTSAETVFIKHDGIDWDSDL